MGLCSVSMCIAHIVLLPFCHWNSKKMFAHYWKQCWVENNLYSWPSKLTYSCQKMYLDSRQLTKGRIKSLYFKRIPNLGVLDRIRIIAFQSGNCHIVSPWGCPQTSTKYNLPLPLMETKLNAQSCLQWSVFRAIMLRNLHFCRMRTILERN